MAYDYTSILQAQWERLQMEASQASAELEAARMREDADSTNYYASKILECDAQREQLARRASQFAQTQARPQGNRYGLTDAEQEVAKNFTHDSNLSEDDRMKIYSEQKSKYQHMRATGQYRDDQGSLKR